MKRVTDIMAEIAAASQEQTSGIEQVNQAITQMDQTTQQNAALVEEAAAAADSMQRAGAEPHEGRCECSNCAQTRGRAVPPPAPLPHERSRPSNAAAPIARRTSRACPRLNPELAPQPKTAKTANGDDNWQEF